MQRFKLKSFLLLCAIVFTASCTSNLPMPSPETQADTFMAKGFNQFEHGQFALAIDNWQQAADFYQQIGKIDLSIKALLRLAEGYQRLGHYQKADSTLKMALKQANNSGDDIQKAKVLGSLGQLCYVRGQVEEAQEHLEKSVQLAKQAKQPILQAWGLLHLGPVLAAQQKYLMAQTQLTQSIQLARQQKKPLLALKGLMNQVLIGLQMGDEQKVPTQLVSLWTQLRQLPDSHEKAYLLLKLSRLVEQSKASKINFGLQAQSILNMVRMTAEAINDQYAFSQASGQLGYLYEQANRYDEALQLTRLAHASAEQINAKRLLYRWDWQRGQMLKAQGNIEDAIIAYQSAKQTLDQLKLAPQDLKNDCQTLTHSPDFKTVIEPLFLEFADLLLQRAKLDVNKTRQQADRHEARDVIESLKKTEIQDYFESQCATELLGKARNVDDIGENTAVLYPIVFENRLELLLSLPDKKIEQVSQPVTKKQVKETVKNLRNKLETNWLEHDYLKEAQQLYQWLIQPIASTLEKYQIKTLIVVPEHYLRTIPLSVLYDKEQKQFLMEQYALAITTGVTLTEPNFNTLADKNIPVLSSGLTQVTSEIETQFKALRLAQAELDKMQGFYPNQKPLKGKDFTIENLAQNFKNAPYQLLHINSHAQFTSNSKDVFIVTYNDFLTLDQLENIIKPRKYRKDEPLELLTLNACETAKGDERAALGLSGIALKAGARSAMATLWAVYDEAATLFTLEFYKHLESGLSKAQALQKSQKVFLIDPRFKHPHYWAAFILIGNWL